MQTLSRRHFLRSAGLVSGSLAWPARRLLDDDPPAAEPAPPPPVTHWDGSPLGRILLNVMTVYQEPTWRAKHAGTYYFYNDIVPVHQAVGGEGLYNTNHTWLETEDGYIYSSWVQPVAEQYHSPVEIGEGGAWGEVTVPISLARSGPGDDAYVRQRVTYSQVGRIGALEAGYYRVDEIYGSSYWLKAEHVRILSPEEVGPISTHVPPEDKWIEISIRDQVLRAYEGEQVVFTATVSTGVPDSPTSFGEFRVLDKRHGQRMVGGQAGGGYNLAGIPWVCYFTHSWIATHGTYWHNDYGRRHSNGCVNLTPAAARWIFRWTTPVANYWDFRTLADEEGGQPGTRVIVRW